MAPMGRIRSPIVLRFLRPPHLPRNKTAFGLIAPNRSITVAALGEPIPKLIIVIPSWVQLLMDLSFPRTTAPVTSEKRST